MRRRYLVLVITAAVALLTVALALVFGRSGHAAVGLSSIAREGKQLNLAMLPTVARMRLHRGNVKDVYLLTTQHGRSYYRLVREDGSVCYAVGQAASQNGPGLTECWGNNQPPALIDFSVYETSTDNPQIHLWRLEGLATDSSITHVHVSAPDGRVIADVPVTNSVYFFAAPPHDEVAAIDALDSNGALRSHLKIGGGLPSGH